MQSGFATAEQLFRRLNEAAFAGKLRRATARRLYMPTHFVILSKAKDLVHINRYG